jgi:hypothetical protein
MSVRWNWTFKCYYTASNGAAGADVIDAWYKLQDEEVQAELDAILEFFKIARIRSGDDLSLILSRGKHVRG